MVNYKKAMEAYIEKEIVVLKKLDLDELNLAMEAITDAFHRDAKIYTMGNGGSAATASHMVCDFNKGVSSVVGKKFRLQCLNDNVPSVMAIANDMSYDEVFSYQLQGVLEPGDLLVAISGSGNSKNIIKAVEYAKTTGCKVVGITGYSGGKLMQMADYKMHVAVDDMQIVEDIHMIFDHMMMRVFRDNLKNKIRG